jgi:NDP-sugar pyrophosphorylase family protein
MDHKDVIKTDFILVSGDVVTNMKLNVAMDAHRRRRAADKSSIMTLVMRAGMTPAHRVRLGAAGVTTVIDPTTSRLLKYDEHAPVSSGGGSGGSSRAFATGLRVDAAFFSERDDVSIRSDLIETGVYICAPEVLMLFSDNFDYQNVKRDFVSGVLSEEELGNKLFVHEVTKEYLARVHSLRSYDAVSRDIMARWTYPLVPDTNLFSSESRRSSTSGGKYVGGGTPSKGRNFGQKGVSFALDTVSEDSDDDSTDDGSDDGGFQLHSGFNSSGGGGLRREDSSLSQASVGGVGGQPLSSPELGPRGRRSNYRYNPGMVYLDADVKIERSASVTNAVTVGTGTRIAAGASVQQCVIGRNCEVAENVVLHGCYLGDGVVIGPDAVAISSMLCDGVVVKEGAHIAANVVLSNGVVIDRRSSVPSGCRISLIRPPPCGAGGDDSDDELEVPHCQSPSNAAGTAGGGKLTTSFSDDDSDDDANASGADFFGADGPEIAVLNAAYALATDGIPETTIDFSIDVVGSMGAGFIWPVHHSETVPGAAALMGLAVPVDALEQAMKAVAISGDQDDVEGAEEDEDLLGGDEFLAGGDAGGSGGLVGNSSSLSLRGSGSLGNIRGGMRGAASGDLGTLGMTEEEVAAAIAAANEPHFKREVAETFLRCVKEGISHENVVIELNGLKIAEDKTFADCARFMLTTALGLCLPAPLAVSREYRGLYSAGDVDAESKDGKLELLKRTAAQLHRWKDLLTKFLKNEEDQVELLLTLEEFCGEEGDFEGTGEKGAAFAAIFPQLLKLLYERDIVGEEALLAWAEEKTHADEEEKRFLRLAEPFLEWLQEAEEESSDEEEESSEEE